MKNWLRFIFGWYIECTNSWGGNRLDKNNEDEIKLKWAKITHNKMCWLNFNRGCKSSCHNLDLQNFTQENVTS